MRRVAWILVWAAACGHDRDRGASVDVEAQVRAVFPHGASVAPPSDTHGLAVAADGTVTLPELAAGRALALLTDAWGEPTLDLVGGDGRAAKGWSSGAGWCALLDGRRVVFLHCAAGIDHAAPPDDVDPAVIARVRAAFPHGAPLATPADPHGLAIEDGGAVVLPPMPSRQAFEILVDAWGDSETEEFAEGRHHVTIWRHDDRCAVLDQCHDPTQFDHRCWARVAFVPCTSGKAIVDDPRWGSPP